MPTSTNETPTTDPSGPAVPQASRALVRSASTERSAGFRRVLESTRIVQWEADARTWTFTYVGSQAVRLLGHPVERWYESDFWAAHVHPDDREWVVRFREQAAREREAFEFEYRMIAASGQSIWVHDIVAVDLCRHQTLDVRLSGNQVVEPVPHQLAAPISEHLFRLTVDERDLPLGPHRDDRVRGLLDQLPEPRLADACRRFGPFALGHIDEEAANFVALGYTRPSPGNISFLPSRDQTNPQAGPGGLRRAA